MKKEDTANEFQPAGTGKLGTFGGVFTPSILTILGIILFMRLGYVVGNAGLMKALLMIGLANVISVLTSVSLSAVATNLKVKGGGDYYLISRTLGVEFGGAIGAVLFLAQSVSIAFYTIGLGEAVSAMLPYDASYLPQLIAACAALVLFVFAWIGADFATKFQYVVMAALAASLLSFFIGGISHWDSRILAENWTGNPGEHGFWVIFAIFFPAVTGFTQGVSMSGDLKDPGKSLPRGTFTAVGLSILVYFAAALVFAAGMPFDRLSKEYGAMKSLALFGPLIDAGVIAATLSSAMASFLGAPRILQSLAKDRIFPLLLPFAKGAGPSDNPRRGVLLSALIAFATIGLGKLNLIAPVVSMFFLISYGLLNYATFFEARARSPSFRPRFKYFNYRFSLLGAVACLAVMVAIDILASVAAASVLLAIHQYLKRTSGPARWADSQRSYNFHMLRKNLFAVASEPEHPRDWRPRFLVFSKDEGRRERLLRFSSYLEGDSGITTAVRILEGHGAKARKLREEMEAQLNRQITEQGLKAFALVVVAPNMITGGRLLIQSYGVGPVRANTVILNWREQRPDQDDPAGEKQYGRYLQTALRLGCNVVVLDAEEEEWSAMQRLPGEERRIDVWWWNDATSRLMLLLAYLMTRNKEWSDAKIRVITAAGDDGEEASLEALKRMLDEARIEAEPKVLSEITAHAMEEQSREAAVVFLPFRIEQYQPKDLFGERLDDLFTRLPVVAMVLAAEDIPLDADPEEGTSGEAAAVMDAAEDARKKAADAEREAKKAAEEAAAILERLRKAAETGAGKEERESLEKEVTAAKDAAEKTQRRAAKARAKAEDAAKEAEALEGKQDNREKDPER